jgi:NSS family neurotransmitter:Na+ symporter
LLADFVANNIFLILGAVLMALFVGWVWKIPNFGKEAGIESKSALNLWAFLIKFLAPIVMIVIWLFNLGLLDRIFSIFK